MYREIYLHRRFFIVLLCSVFALIMTYVVPVFYAWVLWFLCVAGVVIIMDMVLLFGFGKVMDVTREVAEKCSNGEDNRVTIRVTSGYRFTVGVRILDEIPPEFQRRDLKLKHFLTPMGKWTFVYTLHPVNRGEYEFGKVHVFVTSRFSLVERRYSFDVTQRIAVYPSFVQMRKYELLAFSNQQAECGIKRIRIAGVSTTFEQITPYVSGDDPRTINWKATAKYNRMMVNSYMEERSQQIYCLIDKGRTMQSPFLGMSMLDYAINASLALTNIILKKGDKAGLFTFSNVPEVLIKADNRGMQLNRISEALYNQRTHFLESDFEPLCVVADRQIPTRSLLILFTNFDTVSGMKRQLPALRKLSRTHLVLVVLFENTELRKVLAEPAESVRDIYFKTIAGSFAVEKRKITRELQHLGVYTILTSPEELTVNTINAYLELKARGVI